MRLRFINKYPEAFYYVVMVISIFGGIMNYRHTEEPLENFVWCFVVRIISGIIAVRISVKRYSLMEKTKEKMLDLWGNFKFGGISAFIIGCILEIIFFVQDYKEYGEEQFNEIDNYCELYVLFALVAAGGVVAFLIGYFKYKSLEKKSCSSFY